MMLMTIMCVWHICIHVHALVWLCVCFDLKLADLLAPGIHPSLTPQPWTYKSIVAKPPSFVKTWILGTELRPLCMEHMLFWQLPPQPTILFSCHPLPQMGILCLNSPSVHRQINFHSQPPLGMRSLLVPSGVRHFLLDATFVHSFDIACLLMLSAVLCAVSTLKSLLSWASRNVYIFSLSLPLFI